MTDKKTATEIAKELRDDHADGLGSGLLLEAAEKLITQATAIRVMNNTVNGIITEVEKYESVTSSENTITIDLDTGEWISGSPITSEQGERVAASVLPGVTPEQVREWYDNWITEVNDAEEGH